MSGKYKKIKLPDGTTIDEHRYIMEQHLGRKLETWEVVHHIDGDKSNNDLSNLQLMTRNEHTKLHQIGREYSDETLILFSEAKKGKPRKDLRKLTDEQVHEIKELHEQGYSNAEIGKIYDIHKTTVRRLLKGKTYSDVA